MVVFNIERVRDDQHTINLHSADWTQNIFKSEYASQQLHSVIARLEVAIFKDYFVCAVPIIWVFCDTSETTRSPRIFESTTICVEF